MKKYLTTVLFFLCCACCSFSNLPLDDQISYKVMGEFAQTIRCKGLEANGYGLASDKTNDKLGELSICLTTNEVLTINSARKIIVETAKQFVEYINSNRELQPYLTVFPATIRQVSISLSGRERCSNNSDYVEHAFSHDNKIAYFTDKWNPPHDFGCIHRESFEEAVAILKKVNHPE